IMVLTALGGPVSAGLITDWNEMAVAFVTKQRLLPPQAERVIASVHLAMFDAVNSIEPRYRPYRLAVITTRDASPEAAAAVAAGMVLAGLHPNDTEEVNTLMAASLAAIPSSEAKSNGIKVGQEVAAKIVAERKADGASAPDAYRPKTKPGVYVPTPITASRNGDSDDNAATELEETWQPIDNTPMHPEYPCAHCISSAGIATVIEAVLGSPDIPEVTMTSPTAPGVTHRWTNVWAYADEVAMARIYAGFHYRFSTRVGQEMGRKIGQLVVQSLMQKTDLAQAR